LFHYYRLHSSLAALHIGLPRLRLIISRIASIGQPVAELLPFQYVTDVRSNLRHKAFMKRVLFAPGVNREGQKDFLMVTVLNGKLLHITCPCAEKKRKIRCF